MSGGVTFDVRGLPATKKLLASVEGKELQNRLRRGARAAAAPFRVGLKEAATSEPTGNVPKSFQRVRTKVSASARLGGAIVARVKPLSALFNIFEPGASAHVIAPKGKPLSGLGSGFAFWTPASRKRSRGFFSNKAVRHPGMKARPLIPTAFADNVDQAEDAAAQEIFGASMGAVLGGFDE